MNSPGTYVLREPFRFLWYQITRGEASNLGSDLSPLLFVLVVRATSHESFAESNYNETFLPVNYCSVYNTSQKALQDGTTTKRGLFPTILQTKQRRNAACKVLAKIKDIVQYI